MGDLEVLDSSSASDPFCMVRGMKELAGMLCDYLSFVAIGSPCLNLKPASSNLYSYGSFLPLYQPLVST